MRIRSWKSSSSFPLEQATLFTGCWEYELAAGENTIPHSHQDGQEINLILEGKGLVTVGAVTREVDAGEVIFVPPRIEHSIQNPFSTVLRGLTVEASLPILPTPGGDLGTGDPDVHVTIRDLDSVVEAIPQDLDAPQALQIIIRLFDLAGYLSEQIEQAIGLDTDTGVDALASIEQKVMNAVVLISNGYESDGRSAPKHPRF